MEHTCYISVILPLKLEWEPCYSLPQKFINAGNGSEGLYENEPAVQVGSRVKVIFAGKQYIGTVTAIGIIPETDASKIRDIISIENDMGKILPQEIQLWRQVADYYMCTVGEVYKAAYPSGKTGLEEAKARAEIKEKERTEKRAEKICSKIEREKERLSRKHEQLSRARTEATKEKYAAEIRNIEVSISKAENELAFITKRQESSIGTGTCEKTDRQHPVLTSAQEKAYFEIQTAFKDNTPALLHGITGSGKTEIYIKAALETMERGKNVLYLVPEIALSRQLEDRLHDYFSDSLMTFHSAQTAGAKREIADRIRECNEMSQSEGYMVLGTRSSLFLPHNNLGLVIIDEEHDSSYKQDSPAPRYNGRDTALMLAKIHGADVLLGSATPSLESLYNCGIGKHKYVGLNERYHGSEDSNIELIDTKAERRKRGMRGSFSVKLIEKIRKALDLQEQVIILRSRRSYSPALQCSSCGEIQKCPHCNVSLSLHRHQEGDERMKCHHCGWQAGFSGRCLKCGGDLMQLGAGTQKIEQEAAALFPDARIARLDSDSAQNKSYESKTIRDFSNGDIDILIGTQIVSKGFDFSNLSLVAIVAADTLLAAQDFRADEKAIQLLEQLRGRCGRRGTKGTFIIQTAQPEHPVYQRLLTNGITSANQDLLEERKDFSFPPYSRIINITIKDRFEDRAERQAGKLAGILKGIISAAGPYAPNPDRVADMYIRCIRLILAKNRELGRYKEEIRKAVAQFEKNNSYNGHISIDVDPC